MHRAAFADGDIRDAELSVPLLTLSFSFFSLLFVPIVLICKAAAPHPESDRAHRPAAAHMPHS